MKPSQQLLLYKFFQSRLAKKRPMFDVNSTSVGWLPTDENPFFCHCMQTLQSKINFLLLINFCGERKSFLNAGSDYSIKTRILYHHHLPGNTLDSITTPVWRIMGGGFSERFETVLNLFNHCVHPGKSMDEKSLV